MIVNFDKKYCFSEIKEFWGDMKNNFIREAEWKLYHAIDAWIIFHT